MARDYREHLDATALRLLAEATAQKDRALSHSRPHDIARALASPGAARLLDLRHNNDPLQPRLLQLAVAVHHTAEGICQRGWVASDESMVDLELLSFSGQNQHQHFVVGLLASYLNAPAPLDLESPVAVTRPCGLSRLHSLIDLCAEAEPTERAGVLRLLGDEALFTAGMFPAMAHQERLDVALLSRLRAVLPGAVVKLMDEIQGDLRSLLDIYLMFGPIWYRMAAQNLLFRGEHSALSSIASDFGSARRFIVQVRQGALEPLMTDLYPHLTSTEISD